MLLKNKNIIFKIRRSKVTDYAALNITLNKSSYWSFLEIGHPLRLIFAKNIKDMTLKFCIYNSTTLIIRLSYYKLKYCF